MTHLNDTPSGAHAGPPPAPAGTPRRPYRRSVVLPLALIAAGAVLLLVTLGALPAGSGWTLARLWPLLLIARGAELVAARRGGPAHALALGILALAGIGSVWLILGPQGFGAVTAHPIALALPAGAARADVHLGIGVADLTLARGDGGLLVSGDAQTLPGERLETAARLSGDTAALRLQARSSGPVGAWPGQGARWTLRLAPDVPLNLSVTSGVGRARLDLRGLRVRELTVNVGVGQSELTLPQAGPLSARIVGGVGALTLHVPPGLPARLTVKPGVGQVTADFPLTPRGQTYVSAGYDAAPAGQRAEVQITGGVGRVRLDTRP